MDNAEFRSHKRIKVVKDQVTENGVQMYSDARRWQTTWDNEMALRRYLYLSSRKKELIEMKLEQEEAALEKKKWSL